MVNSIFSSVINLFICAAGAGLLSFPYAVKNAGIISMSLITIIFAIINIITDLVYMSVAQRKSNRDLIINGTMVEVVNLSVGKLGSKVALASIWIGGIGTMIGFMILIGDCIIPIADHLCIESNDNNILCVFGKSRAITIILFTLLLVLPASCLRNFSHIIFGSILAALTVLVVCGSVVYKGIDSIDINDFILSDNSLIRPSWRIMLGIPIAVFALGNHTQVVQITREAMKNNSKSEKNIHYSVFIAQVICVVLYLGTGIFGYIAFGSNTKGDVLMNFSNDGIGNICRILMAIHISLAFPGKINCFILFKLIIIFNIKFYIYEVILIPVRSVFFASISSYLIKSDKNHQLHHPEKESLIIEKDYNIDDIPKNKLIIATAIIVLPCSLIAILIPEVVIVFGLLGASIGSLQLYGLPGIICLIESREIKKYLDKLNNNNSILYNEFNETLLNTNMDEDNDDEVNTDIEEYDYFRYFPYSFKLMEKLGWFLIILCLSISILGTSAYIYSCFV